MSDNKNIINSLGIWSILLLSFCLLLKGGFDIKMNKDWGETLIVSGAVGMILGFFWDFNSHRKEGNIINSLISLICAIILIFALYFAFQG